MTRSWIWSFLTVASCAAPLPVAVQPPAQASSPPPAPPPREAEPTPSVRAAASEAQPPPEPPAESETSEVSEVCEALCKRVESACSETVASQCRARCARYEKEACAQEVVEALTCQANAESHSLCLPVAAVSCTQAFQRLRTCQQGKGQAEGPAEKADSPVADWQRFSLAPTVEASVLLPAGSTSFTKAGLPGYRGELEHVTYELVAVPAPGGKVTQGALVQTVIRFVGVGCQQGLRVHGTFESDGRTSTRFESRCNDKSSWHGMLHVWPDKAIAVAVHAPTGVQGVTDPMFDSFETE